MKEIVQGVEWGGRVKNKTFNHKKFIELEVWGGKIDNCTFSSCEFYNCDLGKNGWFTRSSYTNCVFEKTKIYGKYSSMGNHRKKPTLYKNCKFDSVQIIGAHKLYGVEFHNCTFSGKFINCMFNDLKPQSRNHPIGVRFIECDLENMVFENTSIYGKDLFIQCTLPKSGMTYLDNKNNQLIRRVEEIISTIENKDIVIPTSILFSREYHLNQDVIMIDHVLLEGMLKSKDEYQLYESIVKGNIIT
jgi:uncharacterized protein YjbI with pentapeptide repeats